MLRSGLFCALVPHFNLYNPALPPRLDVAELAGVAVQSEDALDVLLRVVIGADDSSEYVVYQGPRRPPSAFADAGLLALGPRHAGGARGGRVCVFGGPCSLPDPTQLPLPVRAVIQRSNYFSGPLQNGTQLAQCRRTAEMWMVSA